MVQVFRDVVLCDSFTRACDELSSRRWIRYMQDQSRWVSPERRLWFIVTQPDRLRGHRVNGIIVIRPTRQDLLRMAYERRAQGVSDAPTYW